MNAQHRDVQVHWIVTAQTASGTGSNSYLYRSSPRRKSKVRRPRAIASRTSWARSTTPGESACYDQCATNWPPLVATEPLTLVSGIPGELGTITRTDGTMQVTYDGMPLYYYAQDAEGGDANGQGRGDVWFVVAVVPPAAAAEGTPSA